jgi:hypothetical protein
MTAERVARTGATLRNVVAHVPARMAARATRMAASPSLAVLGGPLPVLVVGAIIAIAQAAGRAWIPLDALLYWQASARLDHLYADGWTGAYNYAGPPPVAQAWAILHALPLELVLVAWITFLFGCLWYATRRWALPVIVLGLVGIATGTPAISAPLGIVLLGNVGMLMTAGIVASVRHPGANAVAALTKVGPSVALVWHVARRDRRSVIIGLAVIAIAFGISFALNPTAWVDWIGWVSRNYGSSPIKELPIPFLIRVPVGVAIVGLAARLDRPWLVPIGAGLCIPADYGWSFLTVWIGALGLRGISGRNHGLDLGVPMGGGVRD